MSKRLILHDLPKEQAEKFLPPASDETTIFSATPRIHHCLGCFGCWVKTPGRCVVGDRGAGFAGLLAAHDEFATVSRNAFGWLSSEIKAFVDRSIGYILPFFVDREGETHHAPRYESRCALKYIFYGPKPSADEERTANAIAKANAVNFLARSCEVVFCPDLAAIETFLR